MPSELRAGIGRITSKLGSDVRAEFAGGTHRDAGADDNLSWSHPRVLATLAMVFLLGAAIGVAGTRAYLHAHMMHRPATLAVRLNALKAELHLTPEQEKTVTRELDDYAKYYQNIEEERMDVAQHGKSRILAVLTPDQQKRFEQLFDQISSR